MVDRVLRNHGLVTRDRKTKVYSPVGYDSLTQEQRQTLVGLCNARLRDFVAKRGKQVFVQRRTSTRNISGTLKYEVLKRAMTSRLLCSFPRRPACSSRHRRSLRKISSRTWEIFNFRSLFSKVFLCLVRSDLSSLLILNLQHLHRHSEEGLSNGLITLSVRTNSLSNIVKHSLLCLLRSSKPG